MTSPVLLVGQSGGPTPVVNASLAGVLEAARQSGRFARVYGLRHGIEGALSGSVVPLDRLSEGELETLARTPAAALGSCRRKLTSGDEERVLDVFQGLGVRWFCYIGGNDSMDTCQRLSRRAQQMGYQLAVFGVPKTIDNDLVETDHCPGYGSAARFWATTTQEATLDLAAMRTYDRVLVLECMGRNAGWLAAATALYKRHERHGPQVLLTPESVFDESAFLARVERAVQRVGYCVVAASETIRDAAGRHVASAGLGEDRFGHSRVGALGETLAALIEHRLKVKARANKPGTYQRSSGAHVSTTDRGEARGAGREAARRLARGESGGMVTLLRPQMGSYRCEYGKVSLEKVANRERQLPGSYLLPDGTGVAPAFVEAITPLLGPAPEPYFELA